MTDKNQEAFEQMQRLTHAAKNFYGSNYKPESLYPPRDTKFLLDEEYIPFDFDTDYDDPLYKEYRRVRMLDNPFEDIKKEDNDTNFTTGLDKENYVTSVKNDKSKLPLYKEIANKIWDKHAPKLPGYESGYLVGMIKSVVDHLGDMDNKNISEIGKQTTNIFKDAAKYYPLLLNDKYKHSVINCQAAQRGQTAEDLVTLLSRHKEFFDVNLLKSNQFNESIKDSQANTLGRSLGRLNKNGNCEEMVAKHISRNY